MASKESDAKLRIPIALVVIALAIAALFSTWRPEIEFWFRISGTLMCAILLLWAAMILIGKTKSGSLLLTRRRWKYLTIFGTVVAVILTLVLISILAAWPNRYSPLVPPLFPMLLGLAAAYLYEPEGPRLFKAPDLSDREARAWKRTAIALAMFGFSLGAIVVFATAAGNLYPLALLHPIVVMLLITAAVLGKMLRTRNGQKANR
jgi:hypothetical protein